MKHSFIADFEFIDDDNTNIKLDEYANKFIIDSTKITNFLEEIFHENFVKSLYVNYKSLFYRNGDQQKLFIPYDNSAPKIIELLGMHFYNPIKLPEFIILLNESMSNRSDDSYDMLSYNKLLREICMLNI